jgi:predicted nucleic acid-binding protein
MRHFYLDTNVFISRCKPDDAYHSEAKIIASSLQKGEISAYTSVLTLLETASVAGRLYAHRMKDKGSEQKKMFIIKAIRRLAVMRIRFIHLVGDIQLRLGNVKVDMPTLLADSIFLSFLKALRTLDLMHIAAAARHAKQKIDSEKLGAFITGDPELLARKDEISRIIGMPVLSPKEYVHALGLQ